MLQGGTIREYGNRTLGAIGPCVVRKLVRFHGWPRFRASTAADSAREVRLGGRYGVATHGTLPVRLPLDMQSWELGR